MNEKENRVLIDKKTLVFVQVVLYGKSKVDDKLTLLDVFGTEVFGKIRDFFKVFVEEKELDKDGDDSSKVLQVFVFKLVFLGQGCLGS